MSETNKRKIIDQFLFCLLVSYKGFFIVFTRKLISLFGGDYKFYFFFLTAH